ncbi:hypothetical protein AOQ84DRAFT_411272 [Glonium stellatum]|uniref:Uncharacterized protein n=1 Tax=Glonium stellatum TaxID=574774 RepID=A0A8E2JR02_9PEZI|nr:hypothetical protein AOQ84DRAFT_411272 [Glonium stellatum]
MENHSSDDKLETLYKCPTCERELYRPPHKRVRYWMVSFAIHTTLLLFTFSLLNSFHSPKIPQRKPLSAAEHDSHLVGTISSPLNGHEQYKIEALSSSYWSNELYFGEPNYKSDYAWNNLTWPRSFRLHRKEATRLNLTDSVLVQPGEDFGTMLGVLHNLHCLMMYSEYYYPDASQEEHEHNRIHSLHCLESLRTSALCYPDLNPHPYFWSGNKYHDITVSSKVTRKCVNWEALQQRLELRNFKSSELMANTGPSS